ncbi:MAG: hypothetical protein F6J90_35735 [Moorea sp. SIOASIH]|uniref:hypothetical protein n=1 Tax=Moorena sp. SIOASIH TaxID=2607817 RepID=UPI0013B716F1|nr:hypothetical protein [Moorena sp. SIOASIH]NEO41391.1 hypothetical protein [Moorena sp. SIOASIH]
MALRIQLRTLIQAAKAVAVNFCLLPLANAIARSAIPVGVRNPFSQFLFTQTRSQF